MAVIARSQITIVDLNDAKQLTAYLEASKGDVQLYNPDSQKYIPDYVQAANVVTPKIFASGEGNVTSRCSNFKYVVNGTTYTTANATGNFTVSAAGVLTIKQNVPLSAVSYVIVFTCDYTDPDTGVVSKLEAHKTIARNETGGALLQAVIELPAGYIFDQTQQTSLTARVKAFRGSVEDTTAITYKWEKLNTGGTWTQVGTANTLTVNPADVINFQTYRATVTSTDPNQPGSSSVLVTFEDKTDPYELEILSTKGLIIRTGDTGTELKARVWQGGAVIESETTTEASRKFIYKWTKHDRNGVASNWSGTSSPVKSGNPLTVPAGDVSVRSTIVCEIEKKV